jgi:Ca2+-binding EF-hand superfamily protein
LEEFLDAYGSGRSMDIDGFASLCEAYGLSTDRAASDSMFAYHDADQDGLLNFTEFKQFIDTITF